MTTQVKVWKCLCCLSLCKNCKSMCYFWPDVPRMEFQTNGQYLRHIQICHPCCCRQFEKVYKGRYRVLIFVALLKDMQTRLLDHFCGIRNVPKIHPYPFALEILFELPRVQVNFRLFPIKDRIMVFHVLIIASMFSCI